ncbi:ATG8-interacting protein 1-like [Phragmites australis]|uniref:ATG8-interacting protein 1-like n=1 Tax=Phragmites australis TaxID=29695 RepID=UPI002D780D1C|nr:ATG8-interacting protein 1-like [Phragmites australis]
MADNEKEVVEGTTPRGADWEVVTLTASAYEAAPGPGGAESKSTAGTKGLDTSNSSDALLMSHHFVFPPSEHENLPIHTSVDEIQPEKDVQESSTSVEDYSFKNMAGKNDAGSERIQFYDEDKNLSVDDVEMRDGVPAYGSSHAEDDGHDFVARDDDNEAVDDSDDKLDQTSKPAASKSRDAGASCKCWLKKHMTCLYHQAKETNAIWSVVVAAALVGIVILGRWHKDKLHLDQLKWRSGSAVRGLSTGGRH